MSDPTPPQTGNGSATTVDQPPGPGLPDSLLSRIIAESERAFTARAARPSPIHLKSFAEIEGFAERAATSGMVPKDYINKPGAIVVAVMMGAELGLPPMQALINIAVVNGRPAVWGDAMLGLVKASGHLTDIQETVTGEGEARVATCTVWRAGVRLPTTQTFSVAQAKTAGLWGKNVWAQYPERMLQMRARGFALRDAFPDILRGLLSAEEARDIPWEDTGLPPLGAPPVATAQPITPPRAPAAPPKPSAAPDWFTATNAALQASSAGPAWARVLMTSLEKAPTREDVLAIGNLPGVQQGIKEAPPNYRAFIQAAFSDAMTRFDRGEQVDAKGWDWSSFPIAPPELSRDPP